ncbi:MAG TPA: arsenosugar biosynthesis radical SAM (seleno)protein ArsS [Desulfomonilaceae bacterium]|nr:arsenosugar biosynthesis radical SAM (seleno)protein ArsS [Desulfomonilaceae bacterium]
MGWAGIISPFEEKVPQGLNAQGIGILQVNVGYRCNLTCRHCHVEAGPHRQEAMSMGMMEKCLEVLRCHSIPVVDITGGSPEMHPFLPWFVEECAASGCRVLVRTNGVILLENEYDFLIDLYARNRIEVVISLPHMDPKVTERQRGEGVFGKLIEIIRKLNDRGYGQKGSGLILNLVHNPGGAYLPGPQASLEEDYRRILRERYDAFFSNLFCITNMPIGRYLEYLQRTDNYEDYMKALANAFNPAALKGVMCKSTLSVGPDGTLFDCDFNQVLRLPVNHGAPDHISGFDLDKLAGRRIVVGDHCYGCTAGAGSSCQGETA